MLYALFEVAYSHVFLLLFKLRSDLRRVRKLRQVRINSRTPAPPSYWPLNLLNRYRMGIMHNVYVRTCNDVTCTSDNAGHIINTESHSPLSRPPTSVFARPYPHYSNDFSGVWKGEGESQERLWEIHCRISSKRKQGTCIYMYFVYYLHVHVHNHTT